MGNEAKKCKAHGEFYRHKADYAGCHYPNTDECDRCEQEHVVKSKSRISKKKEEKKNSTPSSPTPSQGKRSLQLLESCRSVLNQKAHSMSHHMLIFGNRTWPDLTEMEAGECAISQKTNYRFPQILVEIGEAGADLEEIEKALASVLFAWKEKSGSYDMQINLRDQRKCVNKAGQIESALNLLLSLEAVWKDYDFSEEMHKDIQEMQETLKKYQPLLKAYCDWLILEAIRHDRPNGKKKKMILTTYSPEAVKQLTSKSHRPAAQSSHNIWDEATCRIVKELRRLNRFSDDQIFKYAGELLNCCYPETYKDTDKDRVRSRYKNITKKK